MNERKPRVRLPEDLDVDTLRACVDTALRLIGADAAIRYGPMMERQLGPEWAHDPTLRRPGTSPISPRDPAFWLRELQNPGSPARMTPALRVVHPVFNHRLAEASRARNSHFHFSDAAIDPPRICNRLVVLKKAADQLRLPCAGEVGEIAERVMMLHDGKLARQPTFAQAEELAQKNAELTAEVERLRAREVEKTEELDRAGDLVSDLIVQLEDSSAAAERHERLQEDLRAARAHVERLRQEADIAAQHQRDVERHQANSDATQLRQPDLPATVAEVLAHLYAAGIGAYSLVDAAKRHLPEHLQLEVVDLNSGVSADYAALLDELGVSRAHVDALPENPRATHAWVASHLAAAQALARTESWEAELAELDSESRSTAKRFLRLGGKSVQLSAKAHRLLERVTSPGAARDVLPMARGIEGGDHIRPGEPWPFERGVDTWVLSSAHQKMHRPGRRAERLRDLIGAQAATSVVKSFLKVRPEGGRVFVDEDGDASTYVDGQLVYLGLISRAP